MQLFVYNPKASKVNWIQRKIREPQQNKQPTNPPHAKIKNVNSKYSAEVLFTPTNCFSCTLLHLHSYNNSATKRKETLCNYVFNIYT